MVIVRIQSATPAALINDAANAHEHTCISCPQNYDYARGSCRRGNTTGPCM